MLRWKSRHVPLLVSLALIAAALSNAGLSFFNWDW